MLLLLKLKSFRVSNSCFVVRLKTLRVEIEICFSHDKFYFSLISWVLFNVIKFHGLFLKLRPSFHNINELILLLLLYLNISCRPSSLLQNLVNMVSNALLLLLVNQNIRVLIETLRDIFAWQMIDPPIALIKHLTMNFL